MEESGRPRSEEKEIVSSLTINQSLPLTIDEYLRERLMPVEGAIPHLPGIDIYGNTIPASTVGGDLFEYINFGQRTSELFS